MNTFETGDCWTKHNIGDKECQECWQSPDECVCGGLIHTEFGDENWDGDYWLYRSCDKCGPNWEYTE